jgi:hypothetical protein
LGLLTPPGSNNNDFQICCQYLFFAALFSPDFPEITSKDILISFALPLPATGNFDPPLNSLDYDQVHHFSESPSGNFSASSAYGSAREGSTFSKNIIDLLPHFGVVQRLFEVVRDHFALR